MLKVMLADDENLALDELRYNLEQFNDIMITGAFSDPTEALSRMVTDKPDVVFLDINMPAVSGLNLAREVLSASNKTDVVFVTAYDSYAVNAFEVSAVDYLLKPVSQDRLARTLETIRIRRKDSLRSSSPIKLILNRLDNVENYIKQTGKKLTVWKDEEIFLIKAQEIVYITVENGVSAVVTERDRFTSRLSIGIWEEKLRGSGFFRCHRGFLVNMEFIERIIPYENNCCGIVMKGGDIKIPVSRSRTKELKDKLGF
jgi:DNA-binding LytR/AlgR family response regulator